MSNTNDMVAPEQSVADVDRDHLSYRPRRLLELCVDEGRTLEDAGRMFNITRERVRQIIKETGVELRAARATARAQKEDRGFVLTTRQDQVASKRQKKKTVDASAPIEPRHDIPRMMRAAEVCDALGVRVQNLQFVQNLPKPVQKVRATRLWLAEEILEFRERPGVIPPARPRP